MQAIESYVPAREANSGHERDPAVGKLSAVLGGALRSLLEGEGELPRSAREGSSAALALLGESQNGSLFPLVHYHGGRQFFPADLVSLFYLAGVYLQIQQGSLPGDGNVERDILRMLRTGDCDAANLILDRITGTLSGPELPDANLEVFARRRGRLDALLRGIGIEGTRCEQKIWDRTPYGRDAQLLGPDNGRDNRITAIATASLLSKIVLGRVAGDVASRQMLDHLRVEPSNGSSVERSRFRLCAGLPPGTRSWGRGSQGPRILHEAVVVQLPSGQRYVLSFLSHLGEKHAGVLEGLGRSVAEGIAAL